MKPLVTVGLLSDTHLSLTETGKKNSFLFEKSLEYISRFSPDCVMVCGDLCDWDCLSDIKATKQVLDKFDFMKRTPLLVTPGNHDAWCATTDNHPAYAGKTVFADYNLFEDFLPDYVYTDRSLTSKEEIRKGFFHTVINGVSFLSVVGFDGHHGYESLQWLKNKLDFLRKKGNTLPVIVITHCLPTNTVASTRSEECRWHSGSIRKLLDGYGEVILFAGHTHYPIDNDNFWQGDFTVINNGTLHRDDDIVKPGCGVLQIYSATNIVYTRYMLDNGVELEKILFGLPEKEEKKNV